MNFTLHIQSKGPLEKLASWLRGTPKLHLLPLETRPIAKDSWIDFGNEHVHLRLFENNDYDPKMLEEEDGWLHYRYILEATANQRRGDPRPIRDAARLLTARLRENGASVELLADWDDDDLDAE